MDHSDKPDSQPKLLNPGTVAVLQNLPPAARAKVLDGASRILARHLKFRSRDTPYPVTEERILTTARPENQGTWTPPPTYLKE